MAHEKPYARAAVQLDHETPGFAHQHKILPDHDISMGLLAPEPRHEPDAMRAA
jgi:hypothetical protein